jgi:Amidase
MAEANATAPAPSATESAPPQPSRPRFFNYPSPKETNVPWKEPPKAGNPVVRGLPLVVGAALVEKLGFVSRFLYGNAGFGELKKLKALEDTECRYDPAVIPIPAGGFHDGEKKWLAAEELRSPPARVEGKQGFYSVIDYHEAYKTGKFTPTDVINALLPMIRRDIEIESRTVHHTAWLTHRVDLITAAAEASTQRYKEGKPLSALDGVPVGIKDEVDIKGYKKTLGSNKDYTLKEEATSWCVEQWEHAGAIVVGKT